MANTGNVFKRCGCTEVVDGKRKQLGRGCPKLRRTDGTWNPRHGTWSYTASVRGPRGKRKQVMRGGYATQGEAQRELDALRDRARRGYVVTDRLTVGEWLTEWIGRKTDLRASTDKAYRSHIRLYLEPLLGHHRLEELRVGHVVDALAEVPGSDANRQRVRATLRSALADAVRETSMLTVNPAALVKLPAGRRPKALVWTDERVTHWREANARLAGSRVTDDNRDELEAAAQPPSPVMVWTPAQLGEFLDAAHDDRQYGLWHTIAHCGLRRGEACGVEWSDVDLERGVLRVRRQIVQLGATRIENAPKSNAGDRSVALDGGTVEVLRVHRKAQLAGRLQWGEAWVPSNKVFARENGAALEPTTVSEQFVRLTARAGLPPVRLHDLRHGAASLMLAAGVPMKVVQEALGHSSSVITADTYTSVYVEVATAAAEAAAALVPRKGRTTS